MAISELKNYAMTKAIAVACYDLEDDHVLASTKNVKSFTNSDSTGVEYLVGGENMVKLLSVMGQQEASFTFTTATDSFDFKTLQLNADIVKGKKDVPTDGTFILETNELTIPKLKGVSTIFTTEENVDGRDGEELKKVVLTPAHYVVGTTLTIVTDGTISDPDTEVEESTVLALSPTLTVNVGDKVDLIPAQELNTDEFTVEGEKVTFHDDMIGQTIHAFFTQEVENTKGYKSAGGQGKTCKLVVTAIFTDVDSKKQFIGKYIAYQAKVQQNDNTQASNEGVPSDVEYVFDCLYSKKHKCSYEVVALERSELQE